MRVENSFNSMAIAANSRVFITPNEIASKKGPANMPKAECSVVSQIKSEGDAAVASMKNKFRSMVGNKIDVYA